MKTLSTVYKRKESIDVMQIRSMCIEHNLYTCGDCKAYEEMFEMCHKYSGNVDDLAHIAWDILDHSDDEELEDYGFETVYETVAWIMSLITSTSMWIRYEAVEVEV